MPTVDSDDALRTAVALCRNVLLCDSAAASELWHNLTIAEQQCVVVALANIANSHAVVILAATRGVPPQQIQRTELAEHLTAKLQSLATTGGE